MQPHVRKNHIVRARHVVSYQRVRCGAIEGYRVSRLHRRRAVRALVVALCHVASAAAVVWWSMLGVCVMSVTWQLHRAVCCCGSSALPEPGWQAAHCASEVMFWRLNMVLYQPDWSVRVFFVLAGVRHMLCTSVACLFNSVVTLSVLC